ncbi:HAD family hydrolase [Luteipulveratus halotolerans]|uniref:HAD family hydrolase n=1 Tax=Luteipulveratus halotolerans TaxID=1631356 RepID=A0A0L6CH24_9MICO|nr:HAD family phosphatase [Luteipulveratus halotolerans]KNX37106.1 HAD family hydrolase [Luteipulveratus halotolerans]
MKQFVLFDHDGVLVDTEPWYYRAGADALAEIGIALDLSQYLEDMGHGLGTWARAREAGVDEETVARLRAVRDDRYQHYLRTETIEIDSVAEVLDELSTDVRMAVVTTSEFELIHQNRNLLDHMDFVLVREDYRRAKPHPEPYLTALSRFGGDPDQTLVVEDSARGLRSAVAAGIDCAVVHNDFTAGQDFSAATHQIGSLRDLIDIVRTR